MGALDKGSRKRIFESLMNEKEIASPPNDNEG